jgi:hypothetical protein
MFRPKSMKMIASQEVMMKYLNVPRRVCPSECEPRFHYPYLRDSRKGTAH